MVVVFSIAKSSICFVEYNSHDSPQVHLIEGIGQSVNRLPQVHQTLVLNVLGDSSELVDQFFETSPECSLPSNVS